MFTINTFPFITEGKHIKQPYGQIRATEIKLFISVTQFPWKGILFRGALQAGWVAGC